NGFGEQRLHLGNGDGRGSGTAVDWSSRRQQRTSGDQHERVAAVVAAVTDDGPRIVDPVGTGKVPPGVLGQHRVEVRFRAGLPEHGTRNLGGGPALDSV